MIYTVCLVLRAERVKGKQCVLSDWVCISPRCPVVIVAVVVALNVDPDTLIFNYENKPVQIYCKFYNQKRKLFR